MTKTLIAATLLAASALAAHAESATYAIDPMHTFATWEILHMGTSTLRGRFDKKEGSITLDTAAKTGKVDVTIDTTSLTTGTPMFDGHLKGKDWLNTAQYGTAKFVGDKFTFDGDKVTSVAGTLTLLGKTEPVTLVASNFKCYENTMIKRETCGGDFSTVIQRSKFGVSNYLNTVAPDDVKLVIQVEAIKQ
ncbi:MAG: hypothetical protein JWP52_655 [Rhizobacter sp.]|nr:hypothetical protein [Rhizobacter sp.]